MTKCGSEYIYIQNLSDFVFLCSPQYKAFHIKNSYASRFDYVHICFQIFLSL
jgi:hypothetical protein